MDIAKKKKITSKQLHKVWMLFDEINHIMSLINEDHNRKGIVSMKYVF